MTIPTQSKQESFISVSRFALLDQLMASNRWPDNSTEDISRFFSCLSTWKHEHFHSQLTRMKAAYLAFSPDRDTKRALEYSVEQRSQMRNNLESDLSGLLKKANYTRLSREDLEQIFQRNNAHGLELVVDLSEYDELLIFYRGKSTETLNIRSWKTLFLKQKQITTGKFQRLFLMLKLKPEEQRIDEIKAAEDISEKQAAKKLKIYRKNLPENSGDDYIYLKLFKNIPEIEMEMLFPNTKIALKPFDKLKLGVTAGGGTGASIIATATKFTAAANPLTAATALAGLGGVIFRQVSKIFTQRNKYTMLLAQKLFFHNLANNRGVLVLLSDRAEEEEIKEAILSYYFIFQGAYQIDELEKLSTDIEVFLHKTFGVSVTFDAAESVSQLIADNIVSDQSGTLIASPLDTARSTLLRHINHSIENRGRIHEPTEA